MARSRKIRRTVVSSAILATLAISAVGFVEYRKFFARPGEAALAMIPDDSLGVISIDLNPSPEQALTFKRIDDSLSRNGMEGVLDKGIIELVLDKADAQAIQPYTRRNGVIAYVQNKSREGETIRSSLMLVALSESEPVTAYLKEHGTLKFFRGAQYYQFRSSSTCLAVRDGYLVVGDRPESIFAVYAVANGLKKPLTSSPDFVAARYAVASDGNLMFFLSPAVAESEPGKSAISRWIGISAAIRDDGLEIIANSKVNLDNFKELVTAARVHPISAEALQTLPAGAYGVMALAQPGAYLKATDDTMTARASRGPAAAIPDVPQIESDAQRELGLDLQREIIPSLMGNLFLAAYPDSTGKSVDGVLALDTSNGSESATALKKMRDHLEGRLKREDGEPLMIREEIPGAEIFRLNPKIRDEAMRDVKDESESMPFDVDAFKQGKNLVVAITPKAVYFASSDEMLKRILASRSAGDQGLAGDPALGLNSTMWQAGNQAIMSYSAARITDAIERDTKWDRLDNEEAKGLRSVLDIFKGTQKPFLTQVQIRPDGETSSRVLIPMAYDKLIDLIGSFTE